MSTPSKVSASLQEMEDDIFDVRRWSHLVDALGSAGVMIDPGALNVLAVPLRELGARLETRWMEAYRQSGGEP
ncbi:hypothetical protein FV232_07285 [Methylobacterium sp. WL30]|uniref:hypothetical protein n=1 Tax=unclassified Methylobacterium TaxID=2615210 RepID=UPI0011CAA8A0|nr:MULTISPECIES: hypothetical protein [unclassified Methylobacterium]TXM95416.1 hypothetical protein FV223_00650 [Methylobacterium sp. WL116]TXN41811.1 hypothetical protein FV225_01005 [Methylobacterium sp. WL93]TXN51876.1 hypothetical protein FV227_05945 [Methylobacterium sp. WL119]TXN68861.1 hypothetical protein FV232_07285 [Methylobacterium sp. WL30]